MNVLTTAVKGFGVFVLGLISLLALLSLFPQLSILSGVVGQSLLENVVVYLIPIMVILWCVVVITRILPTTPAKIKQTIFRLAQTMLFTFIGLYLFGMIFVTYRYIEGAQVMGLKNPYAGGIEWWGYLTITALIAFPVVSLFLVIKSLIMLTGEVFGVQLVNLSATKYTTVATALFFLLAALLVVATFISLQ